MLILKDIEELSKFLIEEEKKYGGVIKNIKRSVISQFEGKYHNIHQGGDRMKSIYHNYSNIYSKHLFSNINNEKQVIIEIGILTGIGLATWCDLFSNSNIIGFDIDPSIFYNNLNNLKKLNAFTKTMPDIYSFDQYADNTELVGKILNGRKIDIVIDDGCHKTDAIMNTFKVLLPFLSDNFKYFIDNSDVHSIFKKDYKFNIDYNNQMTVVYK